MACGLAPNVVFLEEKTCFSCVTLLSGGPVISPRMFIDFSKIPLKFLQIWDGNLPCDTRSYRISQAQICCSLQRALYRTTKACSYTSCTHTRTHAEPARVTICFQLGCTLFLFGRRTKRWIQFQDMLLMKLKLKHVCDWRTKAANQKLLQR